MFSGLLMKFFSSILMGIVMKLPPAIPAVKPSAIQRSGKMAHSE